MKKCPFCKADLEENARFCLYCMASLDEKALISAKKKKRTTALFISLAIFGVILGCFAYLIFGNPDSDILTESEKSKNSSSAEISVSSQQSADATISYPESSDDFSSDLSDVTSDSSEDIDDSNPDSEKKYVFPPVHATSSDNVFLYREAMPADDCHGSTTITANAVVVTGVSKVAEDGIYVIPETINGKKVVAVMDNTFNSEEIKGTVKVIVVPETVKTIHYYAMNKCYNLTDIYFCSDAIGSEGVFLPFGDNLAGTLTVHCSSDCHDREHRQFKFMCDDFGIIYDEWYNEQ